MLSSQRSTRTEAVGEPVAVSELKRHLRLDTSDLDDILAGLITAARQVCETDELWQCLLDQACVDRFSDFQDPMELHWQPVDSVSSITYVDSDGVTQTLSSDVYELGHVNGVGVVRLKYDQQWPTIRGHEDDVTVNYTAGYGAASDVPVRVRQWILMYAAWLFDPALYPPPDKFHSLLSGISQARVLGGD